MFVLGGAGRRVVGRKSPDGWSPGGLTVLYRNMILGFWQEFLELGFLGKMFDEFW